MNNATRFQTISPADMIEPVKRVTIKESTYRGKNGFTVYAGAGRHIFCPTRKQADAYKALLKSTVTREEYDKRSREILLGE